MPQDAIRQSNETCELTGSCPPLATFGHGCIHTAGRDVSVFCVQQRPDKWTERSHEWAMILVALDPVDAVISWRVLDELERHGVAGQFVWCLPARTPHTVEWHGNTDIVVLLVAPEFVRAISATDATTAKLVEFSILARSNLRVWHLVADIRCLCRRADTVAASLLEALGTLLVAQILHHFERLHKTSVPRLPTHRLGEVLDYIDAHLQERFTRATLARIARLSVRSFSRQFKVRTGLVPRDYIRRRRTMRALTLLEEGRLKGAAIAMEVGFYDQSHLRRQIRRLRFEEISTDMVGPSRGSDGVSWRGS
jgi:AraC-like DNA-binding protein